MLDRIKVILNVRGVDLRSKAVLSSNMLECLLCKLLGIFKRLSSVTMHISKGGGVA